MTKHIKEPSVYITTNKKDGVLYTGVTSNLVKRIYEHKNDIGCSFTKHYNCKKLVYYISCDTMETAITKEKQIKAGSRKKKIDLINSINPEWKDLYESIIQ